MAPPRTAPLSTGASTSSPATSPEVPPPPGTRDRILETSADLLRRQGYTGTGIKQIVAEADATLGSLYHYFPGGKAHLGAETIRLAGDIYAELIPAIFDIAPDAPTGVRWFFAGAAAHLIESNYADACPIATVALEISSTNELMRIACADVFERWIGDGAARHSDAGVSAETARELAITMFAALEGAFVLARAQRSIEALEVAGEFVARAVEAAIADQQAPTG
jgi:AcrR family transcriptional regulator